ncbi:hypothetical protein MWU78_21410 [Arenibacter sp. F26102]|uniref:hypothetical protein n=1 Tax=Arenibacter sp. F26102 TaxID=2926416 RepID=UPI001FF6755E|nr:hypothetical protein [Arenibacter sp. F26102]MCK0148219.1 hypothetical protein [Arenibacter sp. F26102]
MNEEQLKQNHPETYNSIFNAGVSAGTKAEAERVGVWMDYADTNLDEVRAGIISGKSITEDVIQFYADVDSKLKSLGTVN